jgi:hypothetical protein
VRNRLAWTVGGLGVAGAFALRALRVRRARGPLQEPPAVDEEPDERALELRRRLEESRALVDEREDFEAGETTVDEAAPAPSLSPEERRRRLHERARATVDEMRRTSAEE